MTKAAPARSAAQRYFANLTQCRESYAECRARLAEVLEENRQLRDALLPDKTTTYEGLHLTPRQRALTEILLAAPSVSQKERIIGRLNVTIKDRWTDDDGGMTTRTFDVLLSRLQKKLTPKGVRIDRRWGGALWMSPESKEIPLALQRQRPD